MRHFKIYTDGSFKQHLGYGTFGIVITENGEILQKINGKVEDFRILEMRNVGTELVACTKAISSFLEIAKEEAATATIYHDYEGLGKWARGDWKAKKQVTQAYANFTQQLCKAGVIRFVWIKGHSGDPLNELADRLAEEAYD